jgi:hypothetical protein
MRKATILSVAFAMLSVVSSQAQPLRGDYIESRSTDVYVAQCFANGEVGLTGKLALMAWHVDEGSWNGVKLDGLTIAAAVRANATLGDPYSDPYPAQSVLMVDNAATPAQREALIAFAHYEGGRLLENIVRVDSVSVVLDVPADLHTGNAVLRAGHLATVITRPLNHHDHICGNESNYYAPLSNVDHAMSAVALTDEFQGDGLDTRWSNHDRRSAYIGTFSEGAAASSASAEAHPVGQ